MAAGTIHVKVVVDNSDALDAIMELEEFVEEIADDCPWRVDAINAARASLDKLTDNLRLEKADR